MSPLLWVDLIPFTLGAIHELGHGLSLPHNLATKEEAKEELHLWGLVITPTARNGETRVKDHS